MSDVIFSIDNTHVPAEESQPFFTSAVTHNDIPDGTEISTRAFNKMSTSIPTPFARLYLFYSAFDALTFQEELTDGAGNQPYIGTAFYGTRDVADNTRFVPNLNHYVVADCLDMLEFLFEYGGDPHLVIEKWDNQDLEKLHTEIIRDPTRRYLSTNEKHNNLYNALKSETVDGRIGNTIYIFKWVENGEASVIGGSSPFTLVYTAPNWRSIKPKDTNFSGGLGNELFIQNLSSAIPPQPLIRRSEAFRKYLYGLLNWHAGANVNAFFKYIKLTKENYDGGGANLTLPPVAFNTAFPNLCNNIEDITINAKANIDGPVEIFNVPLKIYDKNRLDDESDYIIQPTVDHVFEEYNSRGEEVDVANGKKPVVLSTRGIIGKNDAHYWYEAEIPRDCSKLKIPSDESYYERTLPNVPGAIKHPNLRIEDFFEDKIVKTGYRLDRKHFITGFSGNCQYLLPLKPLYFKFFKPEDLKDNFTMEENMDGSVKVSLRVPVQGGNVLFEKTYRNNPAENIQEIVVKDKFNLAIFPFYRLEGNDAKYNCYEVMLGHDGNTTLRFYNHDVNEFSKKDIEAKKGQGKDRSIVNVSSTDRTKDSSTIFGINTTYYRLGESQSSDPDLNTFTEDGSFLFLQSRFGDGVCGLVVPDWSAAKEMKNFGKDSYVFCVDFGTANTHVACAEIKGSVISAANFKKFEYDAGEQVVTLNEAGSYGQFSQFDLYFQREFAPMKIGHGAIEFPIRTIIYERAAGDLNKLFGDLNIGFSLKEEDSTGLNNGKPKSNIKWGEGENSEERITAFFTEIMWMIKNKVLSLGGSVDFKFLFTFPSSMRDTTQSDFAEIWDKARLAVRAGSIINNWDKETTTITGRRLKPYEGTAPWYRSLTEHDATQKFINVDIGGGTFDVIAIQPNIENILCVQGYAFSAKFAADDLWGKGLNANAESKNGFLTNYLKSNEYKKYTQENRGFDNYRNTADSTADTIAYLFKNDEKSKFSKTIKENKKLRSLVLLHFSSIIYYVGRVMMLAEIECPIFMRFTGMGSLYIDLITKGTEDLTNLVRAILRYATNGTLDIPSNFKVEYNKAKYHPKKITAEGGVLMWETTLMGSTMPVVDTDDVMVYGFEDDDDYITKLKETDMIGKKDQLMKRMEHFLQMPKNPEVSSLLKTLDFNDLSHLDYANIKDRLVNSFNQMAMKYNLTAATDTDSKEAIFFWPLKDSIHSLAKDYAH